MGEKAFKLCEVVAFLLAAWGDHLDSDLKNVNQYWYWVMGQVETVRRLFQNLIDSDHRKNEFLKVQLSKLKIWLIQYWVFE